MNIRLNRIKQGPFTRAISLLAQVVSVSQLACCQNASFLLTIHEQLRKSRWFGVKHQIVWHVGIIRFQNHGCQVRKP